MTIDEKISLLEEIGEEIITPEDLQELLISTEKNGERIVAYDGFEPSGQMHIAQGILRTININKMTKAGITFKMLIADWHAMANNKMDGDLERIQTVGKYFIEVWKASGMDMDNVEFVWASDIAADDEYWKLVLQIAKTNSINRFIRTAEIMGREESNELTLAQLIYPAMQAADIFYLKAHIAQLGLDQRKVNMLAREVGPQLGFWKPISISHHMLLGLGKPPANELTTKKRAISLKMSKSKPDTAIFMTDTLDDIKRKVNKAWCPEGIIEENPILEYCKYIIFEKYDSITISRPEKFGGNITFKSYSELEKVFGEGMLHPMDLKQAVIPLIDSLLQPVREHFKNDENARELLEKVQSYRVTR